MATRGLEYHESGRPLGSRGVSEGAIAMALSAGLPGEGIYVLRRNVGNDVCAPPLTSEKLLTFILDRNHRRKGSRGTTPRSSKYWVAAPLFPQYRQPRHCRLIP